MLRIGLTGGIGSGKSTVAKIFEILGVPVYYADDAAKRLMNENADLKENIKSTFGDTIYTDGILNKGMLAAIVFEDKTRLELLNKMVHPVTITDARNWMESRTEPYSIKEAALIFEAEAHKDLDIVIGVYAPEAIRIQRAMARDSISADAVRQRMSRQMNEEEKMKRCDHVIMNDASCLLIPQIIELHKKFLQYAASGKTGKRT